MSDDKYQLFYVGDAGDKKPGPSFASLDAALSAARASKEQCDILCPDGEWYAKQQTVRIDLSSDDDEERARKIAEAADEAVAWMNSRPSRSSRGSKPNDE